MNFNNVGGTHASRQNVRSGLYSESVGSVLPRSDFSPSEINDLPNAQRNNISQTWGLSSHPLAMVYSPLQYFNGLFGEDVALSKGTIFSNLYLPFEGEECGRGRC